MFQILDGTAANGEEVPEESFQSHEPKFFGNTPGRRRFTERNRIQA
jgi:hypothetical protein